MPTLAIAKKRIQKLDLNRIVAKLSSRDTEITHAAKPWSKTKARAAVTQYKRYLWVVRKYGGGGKFLPPSAEIDFIWHAHILDTRAYLRDTRSIFGKVLHHDPYFGLNGKKDRTNLLCSFDKTQELYFQEFGEHIYSLEDL